MHGFLLDENITEEERPDQSRTTPERLTQMARAHHPFHFTSAGEQSKSGWVKEAFAPFAHIFGIIVYSNKCFAIRINNPFFQ